MKACVRRAARRHRVFADGAIRALCWCAGWAIALQAALVMPPVLAIAWLLAGCAAFLLYPRLGRPPWRRRRAALLGLRPPGRALPWVAAAAPPFLAGVVLLVLFLMRLTSDEGPVSFTYPYASRPLGWVVIPLVIGVQAPLVEELAIRGFLQGRATRLFGRLGGGAIGAGVFAAIHLSRAWLFHYFSVGAILGCARASTRSIWSAVALHAAMNLFLWSFRLAPDTVNAWAAASGRVPTAALAVGAGVCYGSSALLLRAGGRARWRSGVRVRHACGDRRVNAIPAAAGGPSAHQA